jgi:large subunit ribosomal protein L10
MPNAQKVEKVEALKAQIEGADALLLAEYRGLSVHDTTEVRRSLSELARFSVVKNTLFQRAASDAGLAELKGLLAGPTAVAFVDGDVVAVAKRVAEAAKRFPSLVLKGAYMEGKVLTAAEAQALASLESRDAMLSQLAGLMKAEMSRAASMFQALQGRFLGVLDAYKARLVPGEVETELTSQSEGEAEAPSGASSPAESEASTDDAGDGAPEETDAEAPADGAENAAEAQTPEADETSEAEASAGDEEE